MIVRCLRGILDGAGAEPAPAILVVANGCSDQTARLAREAAPEATVIELPQASKAAAINHGLAMVQHAPVLVIDADVLCSYRSLAAVAQALAEPGVMAASPAIYVDVGKSGSWVRAYYRVWLQLPYVTDRLIGGGVYGLSHAGLARIGRLPPVIGDDLFVRTRFSPEERRSITHDSAGRSVCTTIMAPRGAIDLIRIEARRLRGKRQVDRVFPTAQTGTINGFGALRDAWRLGTALGDIAVYLATKLAARILHAVASLRGVDRWSRDLSSREPPLEAAQ